MSDPLELFTRINTAMRAGEDASQYFDPDYVIYQDPGMPFGGEFRGAAGFLRSRRAVYDAFGPNCMQLLFKCAEPGGGRASLHFKLTGPAGASNPMEGFTTTVWVFRNDLALETRAYYYDTPRWCEALAAAGVSASPA